MNSDKIKELITSNGEKIQQLHARIHETLKYRADGPDQRKAWKDACATFHEQYDTLAFPGGTDKIDKIPEGDPDIVEAALCFMELRPYYFRSGYMFEVIFRRLKRTSLSKEQSQRFEAIKDKRAEFRKAKRERKT